MNRLILLLAPALLLTLAACGGSSESVATDQPTATATATTASTATAAPTGGDVTAAPTGDGSTAAPTSTGDSPSELPELPPNTIAVSPYKVFAPDAVGLSILYTAQINAEIPEGATTYWYTYVDGEWQQLQQAYVTGLREQQAQGSFDATPKNLVVLAVLS